MLLFHLYSVFQKECTNCHKSLSIYHRPYSGEFLCKGCFTSSIEDKTRKTMNKFSMVDYGDRIAVAVSGGKDSLSLLYIMKKIFDQRSIQKDVVAVTIDEGIKGYRDESLEIVKGFCSKLRIENKILTYKDLFGIDMDDAMLRRPSRKMTSCSMCGTLRRRAIDTIAENVGANVVATAHNLDDQLQTFMINLFAGDIERVGWIYPEPVRYGINNLKKIKPFVEIYEHEIVFYALNKEIPFQSEECPYTHESIRSVIREFLNNLEKAHPGIKYNTYNSILKISKHLKSIPSATQRRRCSVCGRDSVSDICSVCKTIQILTGKINRYR